MNKTDPPLRELLQETVYRYISASAGVAGIVLTRLEPGMSEAALYRCTLTLEPADGTATAAQLPKTATFVAKKAPLRERRVLAHLNSQAQPHVPFSHTLDLSNDVPAWMCLQDVGEINRPVSLAPISDEALRQEAMGLAAIHYRNLERGEALAWLPRVDCEYVTRYVLDRCWRPAWEEALGNSALWQVLEPHRRAVEQAADRLADDMGGLIGETRTQTLLHTDINPSNVLVQDAKPYYIDWQAAHYGSLYLDLPHHFCTRQQAEHYRLALATLGKTVSAAEFDAHYRVAACLIGFRYIWWTLAGWKGQEEDTAWVMHYVGLIKGQV